MTSDTTDETDEIDETKRMALRDRVNRSPVGEFDLPRQVTAHDRDTLATFFERVAAALRGECETDAELYPRTVLHEFMKDHRLEHEEREDGIYSRWFKDTNTHTLTLVLEERHDRQYPSGEDDWLGPVDPEEVDE